MKSKPEKAIQDEPDETRMKRYNLRDLKRLAWTAEDVRARLVNDPQYSKFLAETEDHPI